VSKIDWSKAPEWADGHGLVAHHGITEVWISMDQYAVVGAEDRTYPYGGGTGDHRHNFTRGQVQYITPRPERWDGEGLPAVGTKCEFKANVLGWVEVTITAVTDLSIVFTRPSYQNGRPLVEERLPHKAVERFRPIRTPEQIAADERLHKLRNAHTAIARTLESFRGDIPAEAVSRQVIEAMIDAGYSKQVTP
jgi:hypothetical protein